MVEGGDLLGDLHRIAQGQNMDRQPDLDLLGAGGNCPSYGDWGRQDRPARIEVILSQPDSLGARLFGGIDQLHRVFEYLRLGGPLPRGELYKKSKLHLRLH